MKCDATILVTTCNNISLNIKLRVLFSLSSFLSTFLPSLCTCTYAIHKLLHDATTEQCEGTLNLRRRVILSVVTEVTWTSSPGRFLIGWGSFLEGESLLSIDERQKKENNGEIKGYKV